MPKHPPKPEGRTAPEQQNPRRRRRGTGQPTIQKTVVETDSTHLFDVMPNDVKIAFAEMVMAYSMMELTIEGLIWDITGVSYDDGKLIVRGDLSGKVDLLKKPIERYGLIIDYNRVLIEEMWSAIKDLIPVRNLAVHGIWAMLDGKFPVVISYRLQSILGHVDGERFDVDRLNAMTQQCKNVKKFLDPFRDRVRASPPIRLGRQESANPNNQPPTGTAKK